MEAKLVKALCGQLDDLLTAASELRGKSRYDDLCDLPEAEHHKMLS